METTHSSVIDDIYYSFLKRRNELHHLIKKNQEELHETETLLNSLMENDADMKYFSPRNTEDIYKNEITDARNIIENLNNQNLNFQKEIDDLSIKITELKLFRERNSKNIDLFTSLVEIQEMDRQRIARDLHDTTVQNLTHLIHEIELSSLYIDKDPIQAKLELESCLINLKMIIDEMRAVIFDLRLMSFNDLNFDQCINDLIQKLKKDYPSIYVDTDIEEVTTSFSEFRLLVLLRIIQEALQNALFHSKSDRLQISLNNKDDSLLVNIKDFGIGFDDSVKKENHFGLSIMAERAKIIHAQLKIISHPNEGTLVSICLKKEENYD